MGEGPAAARLPVHPDTQGSGRGLEVIGAEYTQEQIAVGEWVRRLAANSARGWKAFYHTTEWQRARGKALKRDHGMCQRCRREGWYTKATTVHHLKHLRDAPELALTMENLESLCAACHEREHPERHRRRIANELIPERW